MKSNDILITIISLTFLFSSCDESQQSSKSDEDNKATDSIEVAVKSSPWQALNRLTKAHLRGLFAVNEKVIWASGTEGTVLRSIDGGESWAIVSVDGAEALDFRDIHAWDENRAVVMSSGQGVYFYRTEDGGQSWELTYKDERKEVFFNGMDFLNDKDGFAFGDQIDGRFHWLTTLDGGKHWMLSEQERSPMAKLGEASFAASGTSVILTPMGDWLLATGNVDQPRVISGLIVFDTTKGVVPMRGGEASGIYSIALHRINRHYTDLHGIQDSLIAVGGNYKDSTNADRVCAVSHDGGKNWLPVPESDGPRGYRSCVAISPDGKMSICVGRSGSDYSLDKGLHWQALGSEGFYAVTVQNETAWAVGRNGKMARLNISDIRD